VADVSGTRASLRFPQQALRLMSAGGDPDVLHVPGRARHEPPGGPATRAARRAPPVLHKARASHPPRGGCLPFAPGGAHLLFQLVNAPYDRGSLILASNKPPREWGQVFGDEVITSAPLDWLLHHAVVVNIRGAPYRLCDRLANLGARPRAAGPTWSSARSGLGRRVASTSTAPMASGATGSTGSTTTGACRKSFSTLTWREISFRFNHRTEDLSPRSLILKLLQLIPTTVLA